MLAHEAPAPRAAPTLVLELLERPLGAAEAGALWRRAVPSALRESPPVASAPFEALLERYLAELAEAQRMLRTAGSFDAAPLLARLAEGLPTADHLLALANALDAAQIERAGALFFEATLRFAQGVRASPPAAPRRFASPIGEIVIGSAGNDEHGPRAALIVDPGGDDVYERAPASAGAVSVIVDLAGNDRYRGADAALGALSALVELAGDDHYEMRGPGLGAAIGGAALLVDFAGNDVYRGGHFAQGAAAFGVGALLDLDGDDRYEIAAWGQGLGLAGGLGLLWDRAGDDRYSAGGVADPFDRGRLSGAQGAAFGYRTLLAGGIGILRDEQGDDRYEAELFAQGSGYYYGLGLLWDNAGADRYRAVRYAQGSGAHQAAGVLADDAGDDLYELAYGVGQGMGLDLALGVLVDGAGEDRYRARFLAQGAATANGLGLLADAGGADRLRIADARGWGEAEPARGLPSVALLLRDEGRALLERVEAPSVAPVAAAPVCVPAEVDLEKLRREDFDALHAAGESLRCALERGGRWEDAERLLARDPADPLAAWIAPALAAAPEALRAKLREVLRRHPSCGVRASVLTKDRADEALGSSCWRLQAAALGLGAGPAPGVSLPRFLRDR